MAHDEIELPRRTEPDPSAPERATQPQPKKRSGWARELIETLLLTVVIFVGVRAVVQSFRVEGHSMDPNLAPSELLLVNKAVYWRMDGWPLEAFAQDSNGESEENFLFHAPNRGEVIVFHAPRDPGRDYIKRVIGVPGDRIAIRDGAVYVNGDRLEEPYLDGDVVTETNPFGRSQWVVPENSVFVLGDNRSGSSDSRDWGFVPYENVVGKAMFAYWPVNEWGAIPGVLVLLRLP